MAVEYRQALRGVTPYKPARSLESVRREYGLEEIIKLAGNENSHGASPLVARALAEFNSELTRYPDMHCTALRSALAEKLGLGHEQLVFGNGSFELISLVAQTFLAPGDEAIIPAPSFGWYTVAITQAGGVPVHVALDDHCVDLGAVLAAVTDRTRAVCLVNPNNPTGTYFTRARLDAFLGALREDILVILDEAYIDFVYGEDFPDGLDVIRSHGNAVALRTFSKVYGLASLRIGYAAAQPGIIDAISRAKQPLNVNGAAQAAAVAALRDSGHYDHVVGENARGRQLYYRSLGEWGIPYIPTQGNFIMFDTGRDSAQLELEYLKRGVLIRRGAEFGMPTWLRVTIGTERENLKVLSILRELLNL
ncbi:MAG: histidinol-phosphate transaminase [Oscillospiraceae bacterium]|jgi:histidinol-phosphate aminotransferase|nr:histidinol-phosphate transaminase [Oscillospiraceae bacterium]